jgi:hypothetical protein
MRPEAGHSMMARRSSTPGRAKRTMRRALPDRRRGRPRCTCPTCMRRNRTSRPESRASALYPSRPTCNGRRHRPSRSRREQKRRARTRNEADKEGLGAQSCGRSQTLLYNEARPHSKLGWMTPEAYARAISGESGRPAAQPDGSAPASCNTRRPRLRSTQDSRYGWMKNCPRGEGSRPGGCRWDRVPAREAGRTARLPSPTGEGLGVRVQRLAPPDLCGHKAAPSGSVTAPGSIRAC